MLYAIRKKIIHMLGGVTKEEKKKAVLNKMRECEDFANTYLRAKKGSTVGTDEVVTNQYNANGYVVVGSRSCLWECTGGDKVLVAPWVYSWQINNYKNIPYNKAEF